MSTKGKAGSRPGRRVLLLAMGCSLALAVHAQSPVAVEPVGTIFGRAAPDTQVVLVNEETDERREVIVSADGTYIVRGFRSAATA